METNSNLPAIQSELGVIPANRYIQLHQGLKVEKTSEKAIYEFIRNKIKAVYFESGFDKGLDKPTLDSMASVLTNDIQRFYPKLTLDDISEALTLGVRKVYGDYFGISIVVILSWVKSFVSSEDRKKALSDYYSTIAKKHKTQEEIDAIYNEIIPSMVEEYKKTGRISNFGNARYNFLVSKEYIKQDDHLKFINQAYEIVGNQIEQELNNAKLSINRSLAKQLDQALDDIESNPDVVKTACVLCLQDWTKKYIKERGF
jgi:hypothetical protein